MKKNAFSLCLAGTVLFGTVTTPALALSVDKLTDVSQSAWYYPYVQYVADKEYMVGVSENSFAPNMQVTRAMFVTTLAKLDGAAVSTAAIPFTDVPSNAWYSNAVKWAYERGIVAGVSATEFAPNATISREQMCVMMSAFLDYRAQKENKTYKTTVAEKTFLDAASISAWAKDAVKESQMLGLVAGDENGNMNPQKAATRAEAAVMLKQLDAVLAAGTSNTTGGGGGGGSTTETANYTVKATVSVPDSISTTDLELVVTYNGVKVRGSNITGDKSLDEIAVGLTSGENQQAIVNALNAAMDKVKNKTTTRTVNGQQATITVDENGKISATVAVKVTDLTGDDTQRGIALLALTPDQVTTQQMQDLLERLQNGNGSFKVEKDDAAIVQALIDKAGQLGEMPLEEIEQQKQQFLEKNPSMEQALSGMTAENIQQAAQDYKVTLEQEIKPVISNATPGETVEVKVEATTMNVTMDLSKYLEKAEEQYAANKDTVISRVEQEVGTTLTTDQKTALETMYNLYSPSAFVVDNQDGTVSMKPATDYTNMIQQYVEAAGAFYTSLGDRDAASYQDLLNRVENKFGDSYGISYNNVEAFADLLADEDGIFVDASNNFRNSTTVGITVDADDTSYMSWSNLITGRFGQAESILPTQIPGLLDGTYTITLDITKN